MVADVVVVVDVGVGVVCKAYRRLLRRRRYHCDVVACTAGVVICLPGLGLETIRRLCDGTEFFPTPREASEGRAVILSSTPLSLRLRRGVAGGGKGAVGDGAGRCSIRPSMIVRTRTR